MGKPRKSYTQTHCYRGHEYTEQTKRISADGRISCLICCRQNTALCRERKRNTEGKKIHFSEEQIAEMIRAYTGPPRTSMAFVGSLFGVSQIVIDRVFRENGVVKG